MSEQLASVMSGIQTDYNKKTGGANILDNQQGVILAINQLLGNIGKQRSQQNYMAGPFPPDVNGDKVTEVVAGTKGHQITPNVAGPQAQEAARNLIQMSEMQNQLDGTDKIQFLTQELKRLGLMK
jgi:hypothetical protein